MTAELIIHLADIQAVADTLRIQERKLRDLGLTVLALKLGSVANTLEVKVAELVRKNP